MEEFDFHTHNQNAGPMAIINLPMMAALPENGQYSVGIHPWDTCGSAEKEWQWVECAAMSPQVAAIGETGLDALRGAPLDKQEEIFRQHVALSERLGKPLIIHATKTLQRIIELRKELKPAQKWVIHGFRGKPQMARQLINAGFDISLGEKFNPEVPACVPLDRLHAETDDSSLPISEIISRILSYK